MRLYLSAITTILRAAWENRTPVPSMASWYNNHYTNAAKILQLHHKVIWSRVVELDHSNWFCRPGPNRSANPTLLLLPCKWINFIKKFWIIFFYIPSYISFKFNTIIIKIFFNFFNPSK